MSDEERKSDVPATGAPEAEAQKPAVDPAATPAAEADKPAAEKPAETQSQASEKPVEAPDKAEAPAKPVAEKSAAAEKPVASSDAPAAEKPARPTPAAKPAAAKPAAKPAPPPDPRVEAAKAKAEQLRAAIEAHFAPADSSTRAITAGAVERTLAADAASNAAQAATDAGASDGALADANSADASPAAEAPAADSAATSAAADAAEPAAAQPPAAAAEPAKPGVVVETGAALYTPIVVIDKDYWRDAVEFLRTDDNWKLNYIEMMAGTDYPANGYIEVVVYVQSTSLDHWVCLKTRADRDNPVLPSLVPIHPGVNWEEREIYDLLGVTFTDHPDLRRIMMWDDYNGHPLRKDFNEWEVGEDADGSSR